MEQQVLAFLHQPFPLWEAGTTQLLVDQKWTQLRAEGLFDPLHYATDWFLKKDKTATASPAKREEILEGSGIFLEYPTDTLRGFYAEHGLEPMSIEDIHQTGAIYKVQAALEMLGKVEGVQACMTLLVRCIQVLKQEDPEIDISYSHPDIPFTIFVTVCEDLDTISSFRVAESILHEAMHLKLTLIEGVVPLIKEDARGKFFSPWRDELRPARGVLHGMFVFRAVGEYCGEVEEKWDAKVNLYLRHRTADIQAALSQLIPFGSCEDLTMQGKQLTNNLLPLS
jgi:HEXXH motif-containing protein